LNDRFLFIKEIFNNNSEKYNTIIDQLDKMETIQQAVDYLKVNLSLQKNETSMKFVDLLKRRFTK
jgi:dihydroorotate dehydrogenase